MADRVLEFWDDRARLGELAGTRDIWAKRLEMETIARYVKDGLRVLDAGCGNGLTLVDLARRFRIDGLGIDFAPQMIETAEELAAEQRLQGTLNFRVGLLPGLQQALQGEAPFDLVFTERTIINLPDWPTQEQAIQELGEAVSVGGLFLMCENSQDGLDELNELRVGVGLPAITPPWHNRYLRDRELATGRYGSLRLKEVVYYSSTYYLLSRVVNAWLAAQDGNEPSYDSPINDLAIKLPAIGQLGQGRLWIWQREA